MDAGLQPTDVSLSALRRHSAGADMVNQDPGREDTPPPPDLMERVQTIHAKVIQVEAWFNATELLHTERSDLLERITKDWRKWRPVLYGIEPVWYPPLPEDQPPKEAISPTAGYRDNPRVTVVIAPRSRWQRLVRFVRVLLHAVHEAVEMEHAARLARLEQEALRDDGDQR